MVFDCFSFVAVKMGLKLLTGKQALYEMGEGEDELSGMFKKQSKFSPQRTGEKEISQSCF
jgi:hypothetical protein